MIILNLFLTFLKIGAVSFGGGYGMLSLMREECLSFGWLTEEEFMNFIAVSESTPGPIAINMATFIGSCQAGIWGSLAATLGVVLPSFAIILFIAMVMKNLLKFAGVKAVLESVRPAVVGLIIATAVTLFISVIFGIEKIGEDFSFDYKGLILFVLIISVTLIYKKIKGKYISPIILIIASGVMGILIYS